MARPLPMQGHHPFGDGGQFVADLRAGGRPVGSAHSRQSRGLPAGVGADRRQLVGRHVELVPGRVGEQQIVALDAGHLLGDEALELPDPVPVVDDVASLFEISISLTGGGSPPRDVTVGPAPPAIS